MFPTFLNTLAWWQWTILALVPPAIVALYFLKLKRQSLEVPSTYLWHKSIEDLHVNSIWQRLRNNLLLLLQLLLVLLAMTALMRPGWRGAELSGNRFIFLVDHSASMSATDVRPTRLDEAKRRVLELIDQAPSESKVMIISFSDTAEVVQEFTDNRRLLRQRLQAIAPTARTTSLTRALELAAGLANPGRIATEAGDEQVADALPATLYIFSDGKLDKVPDFALGNLTPIFVPIGHPDADNVAITAFNTRRSEVTPGQLQAFGQLANHAPQAVDVTVELRVGEMLLDADQLQVPANGTRSVVFELGELPPGSVRLEIDANDALPLDNIAYAAINAPRRGRVLFVSPGDQAVLFALSTQRAGQLVDVETATPEILNSKSFQQAAAAGNYDLIIYDQCRPEQMPQGNTMLIGHLPPLANWHGDKEAKHATGPQIIDTNREHPIMQLIELGNILIADSVILEPPPGSSLLIDSDRGPLCAIGPRGAFEDLVLGFEIVHTTDAGQTFNTDWPIERLSFPTFFLNIVGYLGGGQNPDQISSVQPGQPLELTSTAQAEQLEVTTPRDVSQAVPRDRHGTFQFHDTDWQGIYRVDEKETPPRWFAVNLFDSSESDLRTDPSGKLQIGYVDIEGQEDWQPARRETWKILLLLALAVLAIEWYIYNRRVAI